METEDYIATQISDFYAAFNRLDADSMNAHYSDEATFEDPAFGILNSEELRAMWQMLCRSQRKNPFNVKASQIRVKGNKATARWDAYYSFSKTGRKVHNIINAEFEFKEGKIIKHIDSFDLYRWSRQAMGPVGWLVGWTPYFRKKIQEQTKNMLMGALKS